jgi:hypothetical protein
MGMSLSRVYWMKPYLARYHTVVRATNEAGSWKFLRSHHVACTKTMSQIAVSSMIDLTTSKVEEFQTKLVLGNFFGHTTPLALVTKRRSE